jgi:hypothetical protein
MAYLSIIALSMALGVYGDRPIVLSAGDDWPSWSRPNVTEERIQQDAADCEKDARMHSPSFGNSMIGAQRVDDLKDRCMRARGYYQVRKDGTRVN